MAAGCRIMATSLRRKAIKIEFNINVEQFLNGIDSIDECDTYELPMAQ